MTEIQYIKGDATTPLAPPDSNRIIVHVCNDIGGWGMGFVLAISRKWDEPEVAYRGYAQKCKEPFLRLGAVQLVQVEDSLWVANLIGQHKIGRPKNGGPPPIRYEAVRRGLKRVAEKAVVLGASVHMPRIGCGLAGGTWDVMGPIIEEELCALDIPVTVYDYEPPVTKKRKASSQPKQQHHTNQKSITEWAKPKTKS
ncbi:helicase-DNA-binding protein 1-like [Seminavis robusta]|uniref:Helicase-DNA-binding protein 1-like n=1 Tax=Seminavis robusta TaxID=568900 RepID=A0A9N8EB19_9STRA|nr:helicase-DNA-binding protein 1-like [Seminavis robusta]|eukprot:Sro885_g216010.1 helicase-DNA-binding protein 1-like (197) ;mRNA; f:1450-2040